MFNTRTFIFVCALAFTYSVSAAAPNETARSPVESVTLSIDNTTFIDANQILMFVTNHGSYGRDLGDVFPISAYPGNGTWWPYTGDTSLISHNIDGIARKCPLFSAGLWMGAVDFLTNDTVVAIAEYSSEYVPGPMEGGTYMPDDPSFRVYKLYMDSLAGNPNTDYLSWPIDQGAPVDISNNPIMLGRQMLWSVYNDADPSVHTNMAGETAPLGVEVQQTVWAGDELGEDTIYYGQVFPVERTVGSDLDIEVTAWPVDLDALTGDEYRVTFEDTLLTVPIPECATGNCEDTVAFYAWHLDNLTTCQRVLSWQWPDSTSDVVEGLRVKVTVQPYGFSNFEVVANNSGLLDPPEAGAAGWAGFPVPLDEFGDPKEPTSNQQATADAKWLFHIRDLDAGSPDFASFESFQEYAYPVMRFYDYEMRFTGDNDNPGVNGSYAYDIGLGDAAIWVPFELWQTGVGTPDNTDDDLRLVPIIRDGGIDLGDGLFNLANWGSELAGNCVGYCEHSVSDGDDDPFTDYLYWYVPHDESPGQAGYLAAEAEILAGTFSSYDLFDRSVLLRSVLVSWDGGVEPPFEQDCPEEGTVFRITTLKPDTPPDEFTFTTTAPPYYVGTLEGSSVYVRYKLYNKGDKSLKRMYVGFWSDADLGYASDNLAGCDTLNDIWFCYNGDNDDLYYGTPPPALGFKVLYGPVVPAVDSTAYFDGILLADHMNLGMSAFMHWCCPGLDPEEYQSTYGAFEAINRQGLPYIYDDVNPPETLLYMSSGDPVAGTGDVDYIAGARRMLAASGPFDMAPGDSQFVLIKMAVGAGTDNLNSITEVKAILNEPFDPLTDVGDDPPSGLPANFAVKQNYPNPFNPSTTIQFTIPYRADVTIDIYNILGRKVKRLLDKNLPAGEHFAIWDGKSDAGKSVSTGLYLYRVTAGELVASKKMLLLK